MRSVRLVCLFVFLGSAMLFAQLNTTPSVNHPVLSGSLSQPDPKTQGKILESYGKLPLSFEANQGQTDARVKFLSRGSGYTLFLTGNEAVLTLSGRKADTNKGRSAGASHTLPSNLAATKAGGVLRMKLRSANPAAKVTGVDELPGTSNYFIGNDPKKWRSNVTNYAKVKWCTTAISGSLSMTLLSRRVPTRVASSSMCAGPST